MVDTSSRVARSILEVVREHEELGCVGEDYLLLRDAIKRRIGMDFPHLDVEAIVKGHVIVTMTNGSTVAYMGVSGDSTFFSTARERGKGMDPVEASEWVKSLTDQQRNPEITYGTVEV